jgi:hypothetical protein
MLSSLSAIMTWSFANNSVDSCWFFESLIPVMSCFCNLVIISSKYMLNNVGESGQAMRKKHLETTYKCCTSDADGVIRQWTLPDGVIRQWTLPDGVIRQWTLPDQSVDCNCNSYKTQLCALFSVE